MSLSRVRKLLIVYLLLLVPIGWLATKYQPFLLDGDAVSYMDIADLLHAHRWAGAVNGYWHPLYPAVLAAAQILFQPTRWNEIPAYYFANYAIFLLELVAIVAFAYALARLRTRTQRVNVTPLLSREALALVGAALVVIATQRELATGLVRPDALLQALMLLAFAMLLNALATESLVYAPLMGLFFGLAYLTKSFAFVIALLSIAVMAAFQLWLQRRALARVILNAALALIVFGCIAGPYVAALSHQKHRFDFGDSGALNYAWYSGGVEKMHLEPPPISPRSSFGHATVRLIHPEQQLLASPGIYSYRAEPYGTYPDWFDTTFFNERIIPHLDAPVLIRRDARNAVLIVRYLFNHPEAWILLILLLAFGARLRLGHWRRENFWLPMLLLGLIMWVLYAIVNVEERYVTLAYLVVILPIFAALRAPAPEADEFGTTSSAWLPSASTAMIALLALLAAGESLRLALEQRRYETALPHPWYNAEMFGAARALQQLGVRPGDEIACMGAEACLNQNYWARLAGVRILTEIYNPNGHLFEQWAGLPNRRQVVDILRAQRARVLVAEFDPAEFDPTSPAAQGWVRLDDTTLYALPLTIRDTLTSGAHTTSPTPATLPWNTARQGGP
jgi:4-amino-4-deoxy-L-arabinose transferase-like glycosyltransferase